MSDEYTRETEHGLVSTEEFRRETDVYPDETPIADGGQEIDLTGHTGQSELLSELREFDCVCDAVGSDGSDELVWVWGHSGKLVYSRVVDHIRGAGWKIQAISSCDGPYFWIVPQDD